MEFAITVENIFKSYPGRDALDDVSFSVKKGSVHGFLGPNGAGKSTTMKILSGLLLPSSGHYKVNGTLGFLHEHPPLYPNMKVEDYLNFVFAIYKNEKSRDRTLEIIKKTGLSDVKNRLIGNLSKGFQQRVGIAQAIIHTPEVIILDEPTVGLDPVAIGEIRSLIADLKKDHTILLSSHQLHDVEILCSEITLINDGKIVVTGEIDSILDNLKTNKIIHGRVVKFSEEIKKQMQALFPLKDIEYTKDVEKNNFLIKISLNEKKEIRPELASFLCSPTVGLLEFQEERSDLEDLFKRIV